MNWHSFFFGVAACFVLWVLSYVPGWTNCGKCDCPLHGWLNEEAEPPASTEPEPTSAPEPAKPKPAKPENYLYNFGDIVEHFEFGQGVINGRRNNADIPIYQMNWYEEETNKRHQNFEVWETEIKLADLPDYPKPKPKPAEPVADLDRDLQIQMMEERIEKRLLARMKESED